MIRGKTPFFICVQTLFILCHHQQKLISSSYITNFFTKPFVTVDSIIEVKLYSISDKRTARHQRKCVPGSIPIMEETLGTVYLQ
jgi:hypothetical protein